MSDPTKECPRMFAATRIGEGINEGCKLERENAALRADLDRVTRGTWSKEIARVTAENAALREALEEYVCDEDERGEVELTCVRCRPDGPLNIPGTVCRYHAAKSLLSQGHLQDTRK